MLVVLILFLKHIVINKEVCAKNFIFRSTAENQYKLNNIEPTIFPLPYHNSNSIDLPGIFVFALFSYAHFCLAGLPKLTHKGENSMQLHFAPISKYGIDRSGGSSPASLFSVLIVLYGSFTNRRRMG